MIAASRHLGNTRSLRQRGLAGRRGAQSVIEQLAADQVGPLPQFLQSLQITELRLGVGALGGQHVQKADFALAITGRDQVQRLLGFGQDGRLQGLDLGWGRRRTFQK